MITSYGSGCSYWTKPKVIIKKIKVVQFSIILHSKSEDA